MAEVTITQDGDERQGRYTAAVAGSAATGYLEWEGRGEGVRAATHTIVPREIGGRGVAAELVKALIADAKAQGFRIDPQCSYVERMFERHPEWSDLRA